ncbi:hypothetical protein HDU79_002439 [Rhizoclosmatium sp. JEL0117]|nr:hypothetical protein HDU79_002439 [Rhizoclosmatium sp. JEL0117]
MKSQAQPRYSPQQQMPPPPKQEQHPYPQKQPQPSTRPSHPLQQTTTNPQPTPATSHRPIPNPSTKRRRETSRRYRLTKPQIACLSKLFDIDPSPVSAMHLRVAEVTGMPRKAVRLWFQNARARLRREARNAGFRDPSTPAELKKYQWFLAVGGGEGAIEEDGVRSYDIEGRDVPVKSLMQSAKELNDVLVEYTEGVFGVDRFVSGGAGIGASGSGSRNDDDDEVDEEEEDEEEEE